MLARPARFAWMTSGLYWRTFFLLAFLIAVSMAAWVVSIRIVERTPRADQIAAQVVSIVTITRSALLHSAPASRRELLFDLASNEGIRVYPREDSDKVTQPEDTTLMPLIQSVVRSRLGIETRFAGTVNDIPGFWISFTIDDDDYWLMMDRERIERTSGRQWLGWAAITLLLSLLGAGAAAGTRAHRDKGSQQQFQPDGGRPEPRRIGPDADTGRNFA
jgi:two-component system osmolarity sensor histidine kinase EnvZ